MTSEAIAQVHENDEALFEALIEQAEEKGYQLILGLFDSSSESVYHIVALCRNPDAWEPYKAPRCFDACDAVALWYWFDSEMTTENVAGRMIYTEPDPDNWDDDEELPEVNTDTYEPVYCATDEFCGLSVEDRKQVFARIRQVIDGKITERWGDPPRSDQ